MKWRSILPAIVMALTVTVAGCAIDTETIAAEADFVESTAEQPAVVDPDEPTIGTEASATDRDAPDAEPTESAIGADATRSDIDCSPDGVGTDDEFEFIVAHVVVDGALGEACLGEPDETLQQAWEGLAAITPPGQLADLGLFGGFVAADRSLDETTLAFVNTLDEDGTLFQMSINLDEAVADPDELLLTMAHEFSHVFTATAPEIDRNLGPGGCTTYYNGEGCYRPGSVMAAWIDEFWSDYIDDVDPFGDATSADGEARCDLDPSFFGAYAASTPEEDFAETFSAYVFDLTPDSDAQQDKLDWIDEQPGLAEFRDRARRADLGPLRNNFDLCG